MPTPTPFRDLPPERQAALRAAWAEEADRQGLRVCDLDAKIARFAAWLAPQGVSFGPEDLPHRAAAPRRA